MIGFDLLNEPWGDEQRELAPLYHEAAALIRSHQPDAILFIEGHITTNCGLRTNLSRPAFSGAVYAPHYYKPLPLVLNHWFGIERNINRAFGHMFTTACDWNAPLFVGEFGIPAQAKNASAYMAALYDRLDACLASGAQWNLTPGWCAKSRDGWNGEDFNLLDTNDEPRANFRIRPYPRITAGMPVRFAYHEPDRSRGLEPWLEFTWNAAPELGATEVFVPAELFPAGSLIQSESEETTQFELDLNRQVLRCHVRVPGADDRSTYRACTPTMIRLIILT